MGICRNCGREITLKGELVCPHCGQIPYVCRVCQKEVDTHEENECPFCYWFVCKNHEHDACAPNCFGEQLSTEYNIPIGIIRKIGNRIKGRNILRLCPKNVPISYAKGRLNLFVSKIENNQKSSDRIAFEERLSKIVNKSIGETWPINKIKKDGEYGQEDRDACNWAICLGKCSSKYKIKDDGSGFYFLFERINGNLCEHCHPEQEYKMVCQKCKQQFSQGETECPNCVFKIGDKKGQHKKLRQQKSKVNLCQLPRSNFQLRKEVVIGGF